MDVVKIKRLGLEAYQKPGCPSKWLLPVCLASPAMREKVARLNPNHIGNWEEVEIDTVPHLCYRFTGAQLRSWRGAPFRSLWPQFCSSVGGMVAKEFWPGLWLKFNNESARARNTWEKHHGGYRTDRFDRGESVRASAVRSIYRKESHV